MQGLPKIFTCTFPYPGRTTFLGPFTLDFRPLVDLWCSTDFTGVMSTLHGQASLVFQTAECSTMLSAPCCAEVGRWGRRTKWLVRSCWRIRYRGFDVEAVAPNPVPRPSLLLSCSLSSPVFFQRNTVAFESPLQTMTHPQFSTLKLWVYQ